MARDLADAVVVITGASSGIGRASARLFAAQGTKLVLVARDGDDLLDAAWAVDDGRGDVEAVSADMANEAQVDAIVQTALDRFGRIDVWVNDAAVALYEPFGAAPMDDVRRVIETGLIGYINGCRAVLPVMRQQGSGTVVNVGSVLSRVPAPYVSTYVMAKHGVHALGRCLRAELLDEPGVKVCTVFPGTIDTPLFDHVANYTGRRVKPMPPVVPAERAAAAIVACARRPRRTRYVGTGARLTALQSMLMPGLNERLMGRYVHRAHFADEPAPPTSGNLHRPLGRKPAAEHEGVIDLTTSGPSPVPSSGVTARTGETGIAAFVHPRPTPGAHDDACAAEIIGVEDAAERLHVPVEQVKVMVASGLLNPIGEGSDLRFHVADVIAVRLLGG